MVSRRSIILYVLGVRIRRELRSFILFLVTLILFVAFYLGGGLYQALKNRLPKNVVTIDQYLARMPAPVAAYRCQRDEQPYIILIGPRASWPAAPSDSPAYVFDRHGHIVDWSIDRGDDPDFGQRWDCPGSSLPVNDAVTALRG
jgi:hypothetical protein